MSSATRAPSPPVRTIDDLESVFDGGAKPASSWKIGVEYEKPVVTRATGDAVAYEGSSGIGAVLASIGEHPGWDGVYEDDNLIALGNGRASITLEPGGQLELSGEQCDSLHCARAELERHVDEVVAAGEQLGLAFLGLGITPKTAPADMPWMPKERYRIMRRVMAEVGTLGHRMMQQTATVQANFDYASEADAHRKFRVAMAMSPILIAVSANSPIVDGRDSGYKSYRAHVWTDTDPARCGLLPFAFDTENLFRAYADYALDVPMYFVDRDRGLAPADGMTFRRFMSGGMSGEEATLDDWITHLTTLFPEARLKTYIEVRAADAQPPSSMLATPALMKGLFYTQDCLDAAWDVLGKWTLDQRREGGSQAARHALQGRLGRHTLGDYARELISIAMEGLRRQAAVDEEGRCPADFILESWNGAWKGDVAALVDYATYRR